MASSNPNAITCLQRLDILDIQDGIYIPMACGWVYLCAIVDWASRRVVGWSLREDMTRDIVIDALRMAWFKRHPARQAGLIFHSDRGSQLGFKESSQRRLLERGILGDQAPRRAFAIRGSCEVSH